MLCQFCHTNEAGLVLKQIVDGEIRDIHVCHACAQQEGLAAPHSLGEMLLGSTDMDVPPPAPSACPSCGLTLDDLRRTGRVGCEVCYSVFASYLAPMIRAMQPGTTHVGQTPQLDQRHETLAELREELSDAVADQAFELAAQLRDRIRALEAELPHGSA